MIDSLCPLFLPSCPSRPRRMWFPAAQAKLRRAVWLLLLIAVPAGAQAPQQIADLLRRAQTMERLGNYAQAAELYRTMFEVDRRHPVYYQGLKRCLLELRRYDELLSIVEERLQVAADVQTLVDRGEVLYRQDQREVAFSHWQEVLSRFPTREAHLTVAAAMMENRAYDEAVRVYLAGRERLRDPSAFALELANLHALRLDIGAATQEYVRLLQSDPRQFPLVQRRLMELAREHDAAAEIVQALEQSYAGMRESEPMHRLLATIFLQSQEYARAFREYQALERLAAPLDRSNAGHEIYNFAEEARRAAAYEHAAEAYRLILQSSDNSPYVLPALFGLAQCERAQGRYAEALHSLEKLLERTGSNIRNPWTVRVLREQGEIHFDHLSDMPAAITIYRKIYDSLVAPGNQDRNDAAFRLGDCHLALGDFHQAATWYETARRLGEGQPYVQDRARYALARLAFFQGRFRAAQQLLETITPGTPPGAPGESMVNDALELLLLIEGNIADSSGALRTYASAEYFLARQDTHAAMDSLLQLVQHHPQADLVPLAHFRLGALYEKAGQYDRALQAFGQIVQQYPQSVVGDRALFHLAGIHAQYLHDYVQAQQLFERLLHDYPGSLWLEEARRQVRSLAEKNKSL